jgi:hypothetical protein
VDIRVTLTSFSQGGRCLGKSGGPKTTT